MILMHVGAKISVLKWIAGALLLCLMQCTYAQLVKHDTTELLILIDKAQAIESNDPETAKAIYLQVRKRSEEIGWKTGLLKFYTNYTAVLNQQSRFDSSLQLNLESVALAHQVGDPYYIMATTMNTGLAYNYLNDAETAIRFYVQALPLAEKASNEMVMAILHDNLGNAYSAIKNLEAAKYHLYKSLEISKKIGDTTGICYSYNNLAKLHAELRLFDSALYMVQSGLIVNEKLNSRYLDMVFHLNLSNVHMKQGYYKKMYLPAQYALSIAEKIRDLSGISNACYALGWVKLFDKKPDSCKIYVTKGLLAAEASGSKKEKMQLYELGAQAAIAMGNLIDFDSLRNKSQVLADSLLNEGIQRSAITTVAKFESKKKQERIAQLEADAKLKKRWNYLLSSALILLAVLGWLGLGYFRQKQQIAQQHEALQKARIEELEKEKQLLTTRSLLQGQEEERSRLSRELHDGVGSMLSGIKLSLGAMKGNLLLAEQDAQLFARALNKLDETIAEMRRVAHSMMPEALLRLGLHAAVNDFCEGLVATGKLKVSYQQFGLEKRLPNDVEIVVFRIVQELLTNVIKHSKASDVLVQIIQQENLLMITVEDNGIGFDVKVTENKGAGLGNIQSRLHYLHGSMDIKAEPGKGSSFHIEIPLDS